MDFPLRLIQQTFHPASTVPGISLNLFYRLIYITFHVFRVRAYDSSAIAKGTLFEVPVTVVQPNKLDIGLSNVFTFEPAIFKAGAISRTFIQVPTRATWAVLKLISPNTPANIPARFMVHTMQVLPQRYCKQLETDKVLLVTKESFTTHSFKCQVFSMRCILSEIYEFVELCLNRKTMYWKYALQSCGRTLETHN